MNYNCEHDGDLLSCHPDETVECAHCGKEWIPRGKEKKNRSLMQNSYMWKVVYGMIADETGHSTEEVHAFMKEMFLPRRFISIGKEIQQITKSTTALPAADMESYILQIRVFAAKKLGLQIPFPNE